MGTSVKKKEVVEQEQDINLIMQQIQGRLKVPKNQRNTFGDYNYRSCEDILEALKPVLSTMGCYINLSDNVQMVGSWNYVVATASIFDNRGICLAFSRGWARETEERKKMDSSQLTGAASSYARKYALNGLFALDDTKDADATNKHENGDEKVKTKVEVQAPVTAKEVKEVFPNAKEVEPGDGKDKLDDKTIAKRRRELAVLLRTSGEVAMAWFISRYGNVGKVPADELYGAFKELQNQIEQEA